MTTTLQQLTASQANKETAVNRNFETLSASGMYGKKQSTTTGLTLGYYGGHIAGSTVADGTIALDGSSTVYVVAHRTTGVVSKSTGTTNWDDTATYGRLGVGTTSASAIAYVDWREQSGGWFDRTGTGLTQGTGLDADAAGFRGVPQNPQTGNYTCVADDAGKHLYHASGAGAGDTYTIPANGSVAYEVGTAITFVNMATDAVSIAITTDTLYQAGTGSTGTRTLAQYGVATALKLTSTTWLISGTGLT
jgi:hypothetical protein